MRKKGTMLFTMFFPLSQITCEQTRQAYESANCCDSNNSAVDLVFFSPPSSPPPPISNSDLIKELLGSGGGSAFSHGQRTVDIITDAMVGDMSVIENKYGWFGDISSLSLEVSSVAVVYVNGYYDNVLKKCDDNIYAASTSSIEKARASVLKGFIIGHRASFSGRMVELEQAEEMIIESLETLKDYVRSDVSEIDATVANVLLANVKAMSGKWDDVISLLQMIIDSHGDDYRIANEDEILSMNNVYALKSSVIWGYDMTKDLDILSLGSVYGLTDLYTYGYQWAGNRRAMNEYIYNSMSASDARRKQFFTFPDPSDQNYPYHLTQSDKFTTKTQDGQKRLGNKDDVENMDYIFLRYSEVVLLLAEAYLHKGNNTMFSQTINPLLRARLSDQDFNLVRNEIESSVSSDRLKEFVFEEWRREFWAEGKVLFAMKRLRQKVKRDSRSFALKNEILNYNDSRLLLPRISTIIP